MKVVLGIIIGSAAGYALGYFGRCASGACVLTKNPIITAIVGALLGAMITMGR